MDVRYKPNLLTNLSAKWPSRANMPLDLFLVFRIIRLVIYRVYIFQIVPMVIYLGCITAILFHWGYVQTFAAKVGWLMKRTFQTTAIESVSIAVNIFLSVVSL